MIDVIDAQLSAWGKRQVREQSRSCGFPPWSPMFRDTPSPKGNGGNPVKGLTMVSAADMRDIDAAVQQLGRDDRIIVTETYVIGGTRQAIFLRMGISRQRYYERLDIVHQRVQATLHAMAIGA